MQLALSSVLLAGGSIQSGWFRSRLDSGNLMSALFLGAKTLIADQYSSRFQQERGSARSGSSSGRLCVGLYAVRWPWRSKPAPRMECNHDRGLACTRVL
eukprot:6463204-Amphidinium_carterae.1